MKKGITPKRITIASILTVVAGLQFGSFSVVLETYALGITKLPFRDFILYMQPIHLAIGAVEGIITAAVLCFVYGMRREIIENALNGDSLVKVSKKRVLTCFVIATVLTGGLLSLFASSNPDGLEWSIQGVTGTAELEADTQVYSTVQNVQEKTAFLPDYSFKKEVPAEDSAIGTSVSGLVGGLITLAIVMIAGIAILSYKKIKNTRVS
jgi:cobalt/nickel transport system permease protein